MHAPAQPTPQQQQPKPDRYAILTLEGEEVASRDSYWLALMHGYLMLKNGNFTVEPRNKP